uniref:Cytoplasmic tRNA 2-thiolation protein 1 n=1 Tax=Lygus hesperus TaxID=30085 RepID=A0A0A9ZH38_LYGHE
MDEIVQTIGTQQNCTYCGVLRRQALNVACNELGITKLLTGHNCDDIVETFIMNLLRGDDRHIPQTMEVMTHASALVPRVKPFKYTYEKDIVLYAHFEGVDYFSTECSYSPFAFRGYVRNYVKELERSDPSTLLTFILTAQAFVDLVDQVPPQCANNYRKCIACGNPSSRDFCQACYLLQRLPGFSLRSTRSRVQL